MARPKPLLRLELRPVQAPDCATPGAQVFMLLPRLEQLLGIAPRALGRPMIASSVGGFREAASHTPPRVLH